MFYIQLQADAGYVAYDVLILIQLDRGDLLSNLTLISGTLQPNGCSSGDEVYTALRGNQVQLSHLVLACDAEITLTAQVLTKCY